MKKILIPGASLCTGRRVTTENTLFSDCSKNFQAFLKTFEIAS